MAVPRCVGVCPVCGYHDVQSPSSKEPPLDVTQSPGVTTASKDYPGKETRTSTEPQPNEYVKQIKEQSEIDSLLAESLKGEGVCMCMGASGKEPPCRRVIPGNAKLCTPCEQGYCGPGGKHFYVSH